MAISYASKLNKYGGADKASAYLRTYIDAELNGGTRQLIDYLIKVGVVDKSQERYLYKNVNDFSPYLAAIDASPELSQRAYEVIGLNTPEKRENFAAGIVVPGSVSSGRVSVTGNPKTEMVDGKRVSISTETSTSSATRQPSNQYQGILVRSGGYETANGARGATYRVARMDGSGSWSVSRANKLGIKYNSTPITSQQLEQIQAGKASLSDFVSESYGNSPDVKIDSSSRGEPMSAGAATLPASLNSMDYQMTPQEIAGGQAGIQAYSERIAGLRAGGGSGSIASPGSISGQGGASAVSSADYQMTPQEIAGGQAGIQAYYDRIANLRAGGASSSAPGAAGTGTALASTGIPQLDALLGTLKTYLDGIVAAGNRINPNIEIDPKTAAQFLKQAENEINPYYRSTISAIKDDVSKSLANLQKQYELTKKGTEAQLKDTLATTREQAAGAGTVFSGQRGATERDIASLYNRNLEEQALGLESRIGGTLRETERQIGSKTISDLIPSFSSAQVSTEGRGSVIGGRSLSFAPTGGVTGSLEREKLTATQSRVNELEAAERARRSLNFYNT